MAQTSSMAEGQTATTKNVTLRIARFNPSHDNEKKFMEKVLNNENLPFLLDHSLTEEGTISIEVK